jgi:hypothetical protein
MCSIYHPSNHHVVPPKSLICGAPMLSSWVLAGCCSLLGCFGCWAACEFCITALRGVAYTRYSAQVTDVASWARRHFPLLNAHGPGAEISLATRPGRALYAQGAPGAAPYPVAVQAGGTVYWVAGRSALVGGVAVS